MKTMFTGAMLVVSLALATPASADKGQCSLTDYDTFDCDVATDGGGLTFGLPDGQVFAFALTDDDEGLGYRIPADATPGQRPVELGIFEPLPGQPGCWRALRNDTKFCASVFE